MIEDIFIVCREVNRNTNEVVVYDVGFWIKDNISVALLSIRQRFNPELKYYAIFESNLSGKEYIISLIKKQISSKLYTYV